MVKSALHHDAGPKKYVIRPLGQPAPPPAPPHDRRAGPDRRENPTRSARSPHITVPPIAPFAAITNTVPYDTDPEPRIYTARGSFGSFNAQPEAPACRLCRRLWLGVKRSAECAILYRGRYTNKTAGSGAPTYVDTTTNQISRTKHQAPSTKHQAPSTKHKAQSTKHKAQSTKHKAQSTKHKAQSTKHKAPTHRPPSSSLLLPVVPGQPARWFRLHFECRIDRHSTPTTAPPSCMLAESSPKNPELISPPSVLSVFSVVCSPQFNPHSRGPIKYAP